MESLSAFLHMGGYAGFVWPAYGVALVVMVALFAASLRAVRAREGELDQIQRLRPARRPKRHPDGAASTEGTES